VEKTQGKDLEMVGFPFAKGGAMPFLGFGFAADGSCP